MTNHRDHIKHFLIVFDHERRQLVQSVLSFDNPVEATRAYENLEEAFSDVTDRIEVVLIGSDSLETVAHTHPIFFQSGSTDVFEVRLRELQAHG